MHILLVHTSRNIYDLVQYVSKHTPRTLHKVQHMLVKYLAIA